MIEDQGFDPIKANKIWTSPEQDPYLNGYPDGTYPARKVWLMTENHVGADLLAEVTAALSATSMVFKDIDPDFSQRALDTSVKVYQFATRDADQKPKSYCDFVPCSVNVTFKKNVLAKPYVPPAPDVPVCYYLDWEHRACFISISDTECVDRASKAKEVFLTKEACCNFAKNQEFWTGGTLQGICAIADPTQYSCYTPDPVNRQCINSTMDKYGKGEGCIGPNMEVYSSAQVRL